MKSAAVQRLRRGAEFRWAVHPGLGGKLFADGEDDSSWGRCTLRTGVVDPERGAWLLGLPWGNERFLACHGRRTIGRRAGDV